MEYARQMLLGAAATRPGIPCATCDQYRAMARVKDWLREEELGISAYGKLLVGVVPAAASEYKFARISIEEGVASRPRFDASGRLFRFAVDTAVYFHAPAPGRYTLFAQCLEGAGWGKPSRHVFDIAPAPLCQEVRIDARARLEWDREAENIPVVARPLSHWIR
jgi:hypothetical protein